ncbi:MAG: hypothetical protein KKC53_04440 [Actinobacteria bacterium]|nr:hypothetical protein [Actinomycetota bacterium]
MNTHNKSILIKYFPIFLKVVLFLFLLIICSLLPPVYEKIFGNPELSGKFLVEVDEGFSVSKTIIDSFKSTSYSVYKDKLKNYEIVWIDRVNENLCLKFTKFNENLKTLIPETILDSKKSSYIDYKILVDDAGKINIFYSSINNENRRNNLNNITINKDGKNISSPETIYEGKYIDDINVCFDSQNNIYLVFSDIKEGVTGLSGIKVSSDGNISDTYKLSEIPQGKAKQPKLQFFNDRLYIIWRDIREDPKRPFIYLGVFTQDFEKIFEKKVGRTILYTTNIQAVHFVNENRIYIFRSGLITEEDLSLEIGGHKDIIMDIFDLDGKDITRGEFITRTLKWSYNPYISSNKDKIHLVWMDNRRDRLETYYKLINKDGTIVKDEMRVNDRGEDTYLPKVFPYEDDYAQFFWIGFNPDQTSKVVYKDNKDVVRTNLFNKLGIGSKKEYFFGMGGYLFSLILSSMISILNIGAVILTLILSLIIVNYLVSKMAKSSLHILLIILIVSMIASFSRFFFPGIKNLLNVEFLPSYTIIGYIIASIFTFLFYKFLDFKNQIVAEIIIIVFLWFVFEGIFSTFPAILRIFM